MYDDNPQPVRAGSGASGGRKAQPPHDPGVCSDRQLVCRNTRRKSKFASEHVALASDPLTLLRIHAPREQYLERSEVEKLRQEIRGDTDLHTFKVKELESPHRDGIAVPFTDFFQTYVRGQMALRAA